MRWESLVVFIGVALQTFHPLVSFRWGETCRISCLLGSDIMAHKLLNKLSYNQFFTMLFAIPLCIFKMIFLWVNQQVHFFLPSSPPTCSAHFLCVCYHYVEEKCFQTTNGRSWWERNGKGMSGRGSGDHLKVNFGRDLKGNALKRNDLRSIFNSSKIRRR